MSARRRRPPPYRLGIVGGLGPLASADLYEKITRHTAAASEREHVSVVLLSIPQTPDRTAAILGSGPCPLAELTAAVRVLDALAVELVVLACNTAHHWYDALAAVSRAPILHIADAALGQLAAQGANRRVMILATRGTLASGFYQERLARGGHVPLVPDAMLQERVDRVIAAVKAGDLPGAACVMDEVPPRIAAQRVDAVLLACTELPIAWERATGTRAAPVDAVDVTKALAVAALRRLGCAVAGEGAAAGRGLTASTLVPAAGLPP